MRVKRVKENIGSRLAGLSKQKPFVEKLRTLCGNDLRCSTFAVLPSLEDHPAEKWPLQPPLKSIDIISMMMISIDLLLSSQPLVLPWTLRLSCSGTDMPERPGWPRSDDDSRSGS